MKTLRLATLLFSLTAILPISAQEFFDTSEPEEIFQYGVRVGFNTAVSTTNSDYASLYNHCSWGTGFDAGVVANINIRDYISLQPGFFYETRSGSYTFIDLETPVTSTSGPSLQISAGNYRRYTFTIPIMASLHFNLAPTVRWNVEAGPYFAFNLKTNGSDKNEYVTPSGRKVSLKHKALDFGFKMGTGFTIYDNYEVYAHYMAGCNDSWKSEVMGGKNKGWVFTLGYLF